MRDPERLNDFYEKLKEMHKKNCPDWRFMQMVCNLQSFYGQDLFYLEEGKFIEKAEQYFECMRLI